LKALFANVLSEHVVDEVDFAGIGRFIALTANDEVNALAAVRFREMFGRENVFPLAGAEVRHMRHEAQWAGQFWFPISAERTSPPPALLGLAVYSQPATSPRVTRCVDARRSAHHILTL
jgi:hypothetical protein